MVVAGSGGAVFGATAEFRVAGSVLDAIDHHHEVRGSENKRGTTGAGLDCKCVDVASEVEECVSKLCLSMGICRTTSASKGIRWVGGWVSRGWVGGDDRGDLPIK